MNKFTTLGRFNGDWRHLLPDLILQSQELTTKELSSTTDLISANPDDFVNSATNLHATFLKMCEIIGLKNAVNKIHVQMPGQVFLTHVDNLSSQFNAPDCNIMRVVIMLTEWEHGHINQYDGEIYSNWKSGDIHTFDWKHTPHCSANAGHNPRISIITSGIISDRTKRFMYHNINKKQTGN